MSKKLNVNEDNLRTFSGLVKATIQNEVQKLDSQIALEEVNRTTDTADIRTTIQNLTLSNITGNGFIKEIKQENGLVTATTSDTATRLKVTTAPTINTTDINVVRGKDLYESINTKIPASFTLSNSDSIGNHTLPNVLTWLARGATLPVVASKSLSIIDFLSAATSIKFSSSGQYTVYSFSSSTMGGSTEGYDDATVSGTVQITIPRSQLNSWLYSFKNKQTDVTTYIFDTIPDSQKAVEIARNMGTVCYTLGNDVYIFITSFEFATLTLKTADATSFTLSGNAKITLKGASFYDSVVGYIPTTNNQSQSFERDFCTDALHYYGSINGLYSTNYTSSGGYTNKSASVSGITFNLTSFFGNALQESGYYVPSAANGNLLLCSSVFCL